MNGELMEIYHLGNCGFADIAPSFPEAGYWGAQPGEPPLKILKFGLDVRPSPLSFSGLNSGVLR